MPAKSLYASYLSVKTGLIWRVFALGFILSGCGAGSGKASENETQDNTAPVISGTPQTNVGAGQSYSFTPAASDADGDSLTFSIENQPSWASFSQSTGLLSGVAEEGDYSNIQITVSDGTDSSSLDRFQISVASATGPTPPPVAEDYVGFGSVTQGANDCPGTLSTYRVTSLSGGSGAGTLRDSVSEDCRIIVFDVGGDINLGDLQISNRYLTIDGSSAPPPGITLINVGRLALEASGGEPVHDVIVNNIRAIGQGGVVESNDLWELDGSSGAPVYNVILDHLTMSNSGDGNVDIYGDVYDITLSNSLIYDSIQGQHYSQSGGLRQRITIYKNVYARLNERQPRIRYNTQQLDFIGNVIYGWGWYEGGAAGMNIDAGAGVPTANVEQNIYHYVTGLNGSADDALVVSDLAGSWFFANNSWPANESQGDSTTNSGRISMLSQGVDYSAPREAANIPLAGTHYPTADETALLQTIDQDINGVSVDPPSPPAPPAGPSAYRGIPEPSDVLGFDVWADYPANQTLSGFQGNANLTCNGTADNPCLIDVTNADFTTVSMSGSYAILQGGQVNTPQNRGSFVSLSGCDRCVIRDMVVSGPGTDEGHSAAVSLSNNTAWIRGRIHGFGDVRPEAGEQDFHGIKSTSGDNIWILDAEIYNCSGDSVQVGDASRGAASNVYIGGGYFHDNRENAVDIKDSNNIVVSGVTMDGFFSTGSSSGEAIVMHDDAFNSKIYDNVITNSRIGIVSSGKDGHIIDGNNVTATTTGIELRATTNIVVTNNTIDAPVAIDVQGGVSGTIQGQ